TVNAIVTLHAVLAVQERHELVDTVILPGPAVQREPVLIRAEAVVAAVATGTRVTLLALRTVDTRSAAVTLRALVTLVALRAGVALVALVAMVALRAGVTLVALVAMVALRAGVTLVTLVTMVALS